MLVDMLWKGTRNLLSRHTSCTVTLGHLGRRSNGLISKWQHSNGDTLMALVKGQGNNERAEIHDVFPKSMIYEKDVIAERCRLFFKHI